MKSITNLKATISGDQITISGKIEEWQPSLRVQQVTIGHASPHNPSWIRHVQISDSDFIVSRMMNGLTVNLDEWMDIAIQVEPKLASVPTFVKQPTKDNLSVVADSETPIDYQWSGSLDGNSFKFIDGETTSTLDKTKIETNKFVICSVKNASGQTDSDMIQVA